MRVAVGSRNPVKIAAVQATFEKIWPDVAVVAAAVPSGVSNMPMRDADCLTGARNRAGAARERLDADFGVGLEGGVHPDPTGLLLVGWVVVVDRNGREGVGGTARLPLPEAIAEQVRNGRELGPLMDELLGEENVKQKGGAVGALTAGLVPRSETFAVAVAYALAPFVAAEFYETE
ncbi:MAG: inosine/xanthosine triphosphatase [Candidatus Promineifilaceae bacterium]